MKKLIITSSNRKITPAEIEDRLEKAYYGVKNQRDGKQFRDRSMREAKDAAEKYMIKIIHSLCDEVELLLK